MKISLIAAMNPQRIIGVKNQLPWHLPADFAWFKLHTVYKPIMMGRKTYESIGHPLPNRMNIVLSRQLFPTIGALWVNNTNHGIEAARATGADELMIIGGGELYRQMLPMADRLYLTIVDKALDADEPDTVTFPEYDGWRIDYAEAHEADARNPYAYTFQFLVRSGPITSPQ